MQNYIDKYSNSANRYNIWPVDLMNVETIIVPFTSKKEVIYTHLYEEEGRKKIAL